MQTNNTIEIIKCGSIIRFKEGYQYRYRHGMVTDKDPWVTINKIHYRDPKEILGLFPETEAVVADKRAQYSVDYILVVVNVSPPENNSSLMCVFCFLDDDHQLASSYTLHSCVLDDRLGRDDTYPMMDNDRKNLLIISNTCKQMAKIRIQ